MVAKNTQKIDHVVYGWSPSLFLSKDKQKSVRGKIHGSLHLFVARKKSLPFSFLRYKKPLCEKHISSFLDAQSMFGLNQWFSN